MSRQRAWLQRPRKGDRGFSLVEVMVAALLLLLVFFGLAQIYTRGRTQIDYEEDRRKATAVAQHRLDGIRRDYRYDDLAGLNGTDTTYVMDHRSYVVSHTVSPVDSIPQATRIDLLITWTADVNGTPVNRTHDCSTILGRGLP